MGIWPLNPHVVVKQTALFQGFGKGQVAFDPLQAGYESTHSSNDADYDEGDPVTAAVEGGGGPAATEGGED